MQGKSQHLSAGTSENIIKGADQSGHIKPGRAADCTCPRPPILPAGGPHGLCAAALGSRLLTSPGV